MGFRALFDLLTPKHIFPFRFFFLLRASHTNKDSFTPPLVFTTSASLFFMPLHLSFQVHSLTVIIVTEGDLNISQLFGLESFFVFFSRLILCNFGNSESSVWLTYILDRQCPLSPWTTAVIECEAEPRGAHRLKMTGMRFKILQNMSSLRVINLIYRLLGSLVRASALHVFKRKH